MTPTTKGDDAVHIKTWVIPIIISLVGGGVTFASTQGTTGERLRVVERQNEEDAQINRIVYQQQVIIPEIQRQIGSIDVTQRSFIDKYDKNREEDQRVFRQILAAVKS